jgi:hypothetical protein
MHYMGASVSALIGAPVEAVWDLVSDPRRHPEIAGSGEVLRIEVLGSGVLQRGRIFLSQQNMRGFSYSTKNRVVIWEPPYRFAWRIGLGPAPGVAQIWSFALQPEAGGTRVENGVILPYALPAFCPFSLLATNIGAQEVAVITPTLENIAEILGSPPPTAFVERRVPPALTVALLPSPWWQALLWLILSAILMALGAALRRSTTP